MTEEPVPAEKPALGDGPAPVAPGGGPAEPPPRQGVDLQLVGLAVVLWIVAMAIVVSKWQRVRVDWQLGNIKERLDTENAIDDPSLESLVAMAQGDDEVVRLIADEVYGPQKNINDPRYRITLVKALERVAGRAAFEALIRCGTDFDPRVRANVYVSLRARGVANQAEHADAVKVLEAALEGEPEPVARAYAVEGLSSLGQLQAPRVGPCWGFLVAFRASRSSDPASIDLRVRQDAAKAVRALSQVPEATLPLDAGASEAARDDQVRAWEAGFVKQEGKLPEGQLGLEEWKAELDKRAGAAGVDTRGGGR